MLQNPNLAAQIAYLPIQAVSPSDINLALLHLSDTWMDTL